MLIIEGGQRGGHYWRELWRYRELFYFLVWRDFLVRYKQTVAGVAWAVLKPFLTMAVLTLIFGRFGKMPSGGVPYSVLVFSGMLPWLFFSSAMSESGNSLVANANLVSKIYFPRLIVPVSGIMTSLIDFLIAGAFLAILMAWHHIVPPVRILFLPCFIAFAFAASFAAGIWISALMVEYRDFRNIVPFMVQFGLYLSPVGFLSAIVPRKFRLLYSLNPVVAIIDGFRWCLLGGQHTIFWPGMFVALAVVSVLLITGIGYFRKTERILADVI